MTVPRSVLGGEVFNVLLLLPVCICVRRVVFSGMGRSESSSVWQMWAGVGVVGVLAVCAPEQYGGGGGGW